LQLRGTFFFCCLGKVIDRLSAGFFIVHEEIGWFKGCMSIFCCHGGVSVVLDGSKWRPLYLPLENILSDALGVRSGKKMEGRAVTRRRCKCMTTIIPLEKIETASFTRVE